MSKGYGVLGLCAALAGCAGSAENMRAEPVWVFQQGTESGKTANQPDPADIQLICHTEDSRRGVFSSIWARLSGAKDQTNENNCVYINAQLVNVLKYSTVDVRSPADVADTQKEPARKIIYTLLSLSDYNCQNFLNRALALRSSSEFSAGLSSNVSSGLSAATAAGDPGISSALSVTSILLNAGSDQFKKTYYLNKTFDLFGKAIESSRKERRKEIVARLEPNATAVATPYVFMQALADVQEYNELCSFRKGLEETEIRVSSPAPASPPPAQNQ